MDGTAHLRQRRRADRGDRRRTRSSACWRTRPAISPAAICRVCASSWRRRRRNRSSPCCSASAPWWRPGRSGRDVGSPRRRDPRAAGGDPPLAAVVSALAGGTGRPRRGEVPHRDRPVAQGHVRDVQAARRPDPVRRSRRRSLRAVASDAGRARVGAGTLAKTSPYWDKQGPRRAATAARPDARQAVRLPRPARHGGAHAIRRATPACRRATPAPSPPIAIAICAPPSPRSTG